MCWEPVAQFLPLSVWGNHQSVSGLGGNICTLTLSWRPPLILSTLQLLFRQTTQHSRPFYVHLGLPKQMHFSLCNPPGSMLYLFRTYNNVQPIKLLFNFAINVRILWNKTFFITYTVKKWFYSKYTGKTGENFTGKNCYFTVYFWHPSCRKILVFLTI